MKKLYDETKAGSVQAPVLGVLGVLVRRSASVLQVVFAAPVAGVSEELPKDPPEAPTRSRCGGL